VLGADAVEWVQAAKNLDPEAARWATAAMDLLTAMGAELDIDSASFGASVPEVPGRVLTVEYVLEPARRYTYVYRCTAHGGSDRAIDRVEFCCAPYTSGPTAGSPQTWKRPRWVGRLLGLAVLALPAELRHDFAVEWASEISSLPSRRERLWFSLSLLIAAPRLRAALRHYSGEDR
jgi:hypothetical protein